MSGSRLNNKRQSKISEDNIIPGTGTNHTKDNLNQISVLQALLSCHVTALQDQLVSWFSISVPDMSLVLLTVGFQTYSSDTRFSLDFQHPNNYRLRVSRVKVEDKGFYHCQLATHPPQLVWTYLDIARPYFRIHDSDNGTLADLHYHQGSQISLQCEVVRGPMQDTSVQWVYTSREQERVVILNEDTVRGGILISTWWLDRDTLISNLTLYKAGPMDKGNYTCSLPHKLAMLGNHTVSVHILNKTMTEPVQGGSKAVWEGEGMLVIMVCTLVIIMGS